MIKLNHVSKYYNELKAVDDLSLEVREGEICVLLGRSGCGKSTTLRMINRLIEPTAGEITIDGKNIEAYVVEQLRRNIGYVVQSIGLFPYMSVEKNISVVPQLLKWEKSKTHSRVEELLELVGLDPDMYINKMPSELSGGEAQRVGVARALAADPPIILMDEPFGAVDPINRQKLQNAFLEIQKKLHKTIVFVTHDIEEALKMGDKIAVMDGGKLQSYSSPEMALDSGNKDFAIKFLGKDYYLKLLSRHGVAEVLKPLTTIVETSGFEAALSVEDNLQDALSTMLHCGAQELPVLDEHGKCCGMISWNDIMSCLKKRD